MVKYALFAKLVALPGKENEVEEFLKSALPIVEAEPGTAQWFAVKFDSATFGIFDTFRDEGARDAHLNGEVAAALKQRAPELFANSPEIQELTVLAGKM